VEGWSAPTKKELEPFRTSKLVGGHDQYRAGKDQQKRNKVRLDCGGGTQSDSNVKKDKKLGVSFNFKNTVTDKGKKP